ncbi:MULTISPECIES: MFS transporter [Rhodococcus]|uniref:Metabolite-proton symporter n=2 Tax=Rhodococcus TaxID=1827 RepID=A0A1H4LQ37_9NOCA|nr:MULTISPECIES: MFS transporter [Rhodococcus]GCE44697.1 putative transporter [Rhodococcus wratislaviensis]SEB72840.1 metabolite-proton symporter [Rhodococcus koreensis]
MSSNSTTANQAPPTSRRGLARVVASSTTGMALEAYDFLLYGSAAALVFNKLFFPAEDPIVGTLLAFLSYALGFFARPIGGLVFGHFGDRIGRKPLLIISLVLMGGATFAIGLLPTYAAIGVWSAIALSALRLIQGFALGGEWGGAMLLVAERVPARRRGAWTSLPEAGIPLGNLIATGVLAVLAATLDDDAFLDWGWRIPFLLSAVLLVVGYWIRSKVEDAPLFVEAHEQAEKAVAEEAPARTVLREHRRELAACASARLTENIVYYVLTAFILVYAVERSGVDKSVVLNALVLANVIQLVATPFFGALSDKLGRRPVLLGGAIGTAVWIWIFFWLLDTGSSPLVFLAMVGGLIFHSALYGPQAAFFAEQFPTRVRYTGMSISAQVTTVIGGAIAPLIAIALLGAFDSSIPVAIYVVTVAVITTIGVGLAKETHRRDLATMHDTAG